MTTRYERPHCRHIERPPDFGAGRGFISRADPPADPLLTFRLEEMPPITITIDAARIADVRRLLLKMRAAELSDLRRVETQLSVYGDRRANMEGEPAAISARIEMLSDLLAQIDAQRSGDAGGAAR